MRTYLSNQAVRSNNGALADPYSSQDGNMASYPHFVVDENITTEAGNITLTAAELVFWTTVSEFW